MAGDSFNGRANVMSGQGRSNEARASSLKRPPPRMSQFGKRDTGPEKLLRKELRRVRVKYRTYPRLPGTPDLVLQDRQLIVFVHGCFWHGCPIHYRGPKSKPLYWKRKLETNQNRHRLAVSRLRRAGWHVFTVWECDIRRSPGAVVRRVLNQTTSK